MKVEVLDPAPCPVIVRLPLWLIRDLATEAVRDGTGLGEVLVKRLRAEPGIGPSRRGDQPAEEAVR